MMNKTIAMNKTYEIPFCAGGLIVDIHSLPLMNYVYAVDDATQ
jgi:hypothetical protein